jgi:hypothetical protein
VIFIYTSFQGEIEMTTTCPNCGKEFADDGYLCIIVNRYTGNVPAIKLEIRGPVQDDAADATSGLTFTRIKGITIDPETGNVGIGY